MAQIMWVIVLVLIITLVQLLIYRYLGGQNGASSLEVYSTDGSPRAMPSDGTSGRPVLDDANRRRCPACGEINDASFTFCRHCVSRIGA